MGTIVMDNFTATVFDWFKQRTPELTGPIQQTYDAVEAGTELSWAERKLVGFMLFDYVMINGLEHEDECLRIAKQLHATDELVAFALDWIKISKK